MNPSEAGMRGVVRAALFALALAASGCVGAAQHRGEPLPGWPPPAGPETLSVTWISAVSDFQVRNSLPALAGKEVDMRKGVGRAFAECPGIRASEGTAGDWDRRVVVSFLMKMKNQRGSTYSILLCGATLGLWPAVSTMDMNLTTTVFDKDGNQLGVYFQRGDQSAYVELFLVFAYPFWPASKAYEDECYELTRRTLLDARSAGVL